MIDSTLKNANIIIVDDQQGNIDLLVGLLEAKGFTSYRTTKESRLVIRLFDEFKPDLLLLDLSMPHLSGFQVMTQLRLHIPANTYFPILVLTADITTETKLKALNGGATDFLSKPFDLIEVDIRINNLLKTRYLHQQLENQNQLLEEKVKDRTKELEKTNIELIAAKEKAEEMNRLKSNFLANMSHELRTPLVGINGFADLLCQDLNDPELKSMAENIYISGSRLSETLNLILDLSMLESKKINFQFQKIDLVSTTDGIIELFKESARKKGLTLKSSFSQPAIFINSDERAVRSILNNLINNAIKFTKKGSVTVNISLIDNFVEIKVIDTGIGIAKEYLGTIFEEFRQVSEGFNRNFEGNGLGLNITKKLVDKFDGKISIESEPGIGSAFIVKLPVTISEERIKKETVIKKVPWAVLTRHKSVKPLALLVDDDSFVYPILKRFTAGQVDLKSTSEGELAVKLCRQNQYAMIFMDINLVRGIDGIQASKAIRKIKGYENIPIIATTAYAMDDEKEEFIAAGCTHYLSKPFRHQDVLTLLGEILD